MAVIDPAKCTGCGQCAENCAVRAIFRTPDGVCQCNQPVCFACGQCAAIWPVRGPVPRGGGVHAGAGAAHPLPPGNL